MRILIADDDTTSRIVLSGVLRKQGHEVEVTEDGEAAWQAMQRPDAPGLAILDWEMPGLVGVEVCRRIRALELDPPPYLIILTSRGEKADIITGLEAGADDYLAKPFDPGELRARVEVGRRMLDIQRRLLEARDALVHQAMHDPLTGALNRRAFTEILAREIAREQRQHQGFAVGVSDIDHFKRINDTHGHLVGDEVLCAVVRRMESSLRGHDVVGRLGGDEFVVLASHVDGATVEGVYERLRSAAIGSPIPTRVGDVSITMSFGVTMWAADASDDDLFAAADAALYRAKEAGRDRVCMADGGGAPIA
ncbi:MAG: diguanylate cyclase [Chloroflexota bacterium]